MARLLNQIIGHDSVRAQLVGALEQDRLGPALLFLGPSGIGKRLMALGLCQAGLCLKEMVGCGQCPSCLRVENKQHEGLLWIEPEGLQIKLDEVKPLQDFLRLRLISRKRFMVIEKADRMTSQAANSLLKILEEPPENTHFILLVTQEGGLLPTLKSRSQVIRFSPLSEEHLKELSEGKKWMLSSAQGRLDRLEQLRNPEYEKFRAEALEAFRRCVGADWLEARSLLASQLKDKESALEVIALWLTLVRDGLAYKSSKSNLMNQDLNFKDLHDFNVPWTFLAENLLRIQSEIHANVDRTLLFENLLNDWSDLK